MTKKAKSQRKNN